MNNKDIERLNYARGIMQDISNKMSEIKSDQGTSYPTGFPNTVLDLDCEIKYNKMVVDLLNYWTEKVGSDELKLGKYIRMYPRVLQTRMELDFCLDSELSSRLYDEVFGSHSTIYIWVHKYFPSVFGMVVGQYLDDIIQRFDNLGFQTRRNGEKHLCWNDSEFQTALFNGKKLIDLLFEISINQELMNDLDEVLKIYFDKIFKNNPDEYWY